MNAVVAQTRLEILLTIRRGEAVLLTLMIPLGILVFFGSTELFDITVEFLVPGLLGLAIMSSAMVSLAVATAYERKYLVLKRLGATPLPRLALLGAKTLAVVALEVVQVALILVVAAWAFGWRAAIDWPLMGLGVVLGTAAFAGVAMLLAGTLRAEATLALANGLYLGMLLLGNVIVAVDRLPETLASAARILPAAPLAGVFGAAVGARQMCVSDLVVLAVWAVITIFLAARLFTWEER